MFFFKPKAKAGGTDWLLIGLGNPGAQYEHTRHNAGFLVIDALAGRAGISMLRLKYRAHVGSVTIGGQNVLLMKPVTYMNRSGEAAAEAASFLKVPPDHILVICDDVALPPGKLRIRRGGSDGGHKGLRSIAQSLHTEAFPRLRIGVGGKPHPDYEMADWVLAKLSGPDQAAMRETAVRAADAAACMITEGMEKAMANYN